MHVLKVHALNYVSQPFCIKKFAEKNANLANNNGTVRDLIGTPHCVNDISTRLHLKSFFFVFRY